MLIAPQLVTAMVMAIKNDYALRHIKLCLGAWAVFTSTGANETATKSIAGIIDSIGASITKTK